MQFERLGRLSALLLTAALPLWTADAPASAPIMPSVPAAHPTTADGKTHPTPPATVPPKPAPEPNPAVDGVEPSDTVLTVTLKNLNQIVGILREKDAECLSLETAEGLMKLRINKVLKIEPGGTLTPTAAAGASKPAAGGAPAGNSPLASPPAAAPATVAPNIPLSQMTPEERMKAAQAKLKANQKAALTYQQAIQTHVGGVPQGVQPTDYATLQKLQQNPQNSSQPYGTKPSTWQPFSSDSPQKSSNNNTAGPVSPTQPVPQWFQPQYLNNLPSDYQNYLPENR